MITRPSPTFVGRVEELELLEAARVRAADGEPAVVLVGGEAGVGKTRLVAELTARCANDGTRVLIGGCVPVGGDGLPYAPIVEALRPLPDELGVDTVRELGGPSWRELARREAEVLALVAEGRTNRQIGQALFITPKTASVHVSRILAKLGVAGRGEAAAVAHRLGLD
jgi:DNA-binding CsgD family transcriptional regulator